MMNFANIGFAVGVWAALTGAAQAQDRLAEIASRFDETALVGSPTIVDCTLSGGIRTKCISITVKQSPDSVTKGPWCPTHVSDGADKGGIWLRDGTVHDVDGAFLDQLATFYGDDFWQVIDPQGGKVKVTDTKESCQAAARPDVDPQYYNHCVECQPSYLEEDAQMTYTIPLEPVVASRPTNRVGRQGVGLSFSGVRLDGPAPVDAILGAHTIAPFDDCGGHVNLHVGYHIHAVTDCLTELPTEDTDHAPLMGLAMDGIALHGQLNSDGAEPSDLDQCRGHETASLGYHYHVGAPGDNAILGCHVAETGCLSSDPNAPCDATKQTRGPGGPPPGGGGIGGFFRNLFGLN